MLTGDFNLSSYLFTASIEVGVSGDDQLVYLQSIPPVGTTHALIDMPRAIGMELAEAGLIRFDALESIHLTACGRLFLRAIERMDGDGLE